jgi:hypothetical protein
MSIAAKALKSGVNGIPSPFDLEIRRKPYVYPLLVPVERGCEKAGRRRRRGWTNLMENMSKPKPIFNYNYHATATIDRLVDLSGFEIIERYPTIRGSTFVIARKVGSGTWPAVENSR